MKEDIEKYYTLSVRYLTRRPRSVKELRDYLVKKKVEPILIDEIIALLERQKFLNDKEFTSWWREQRTRFRTRSDKYIKYELTQKGISKEIIEEVFSHPTMDSMDDASKAKELIIKRVKRLEQFSEKEQYEKLARFLASKGFNWDVVRKAIDDYFKKKYNDD